jgi:hypothetical protein
LQMNFLLAYRFEGYRLNITISGGMGNRKLVACFNCFHSIFDDRYNLLCN